MPKGDNSQAIPNQHPAMISLYPDWTDIIRYLSHIFGTLYKTQGSGLIMEEAMDEGSYSPKDLGYVGHNDNEEMMSFFKLKNLMEVTATCTTETDKMVQCGLMEGSLYRSKAQFQLNVSAYSSLCKKVRLQCISKNVPYSIISYPTHSALPHPTLPDPTLSCPTLPFPALPFPTLPFPALPTLPYPTLPYPTLP